MSPNEIAFFIGLFGSIHCIGMCGPLAFAIPIGQGGKWLLVWDKLLYNFGRIISYTALGTLVGLVGKQLWLAGLQQSISIISGVLIILAAGSRFFKLKVAKGKLGLLLLEPFNKLLVFALKNRAGHLVIGMLNGLLPCGFVYLALIGAVNTGAVLASAKYMAFFGLGTVPLMLAAAIASGFLNATVRRRMNRVVPYFMLCLGVWFVLRGLALDIPYLSPAKDQTGGVICVSH
ncbi:sulfite exporter TauE/SafE family protein [Mucilaginibacter sp. RS28]|uniref:Sulfite exporter TauE/SafE family protein n=1 Tax=Mucilaginibacter straminoryzae TaxID=2932774 RepID=A0A9X1X1C0_9SPHI|nr:sulfite exporter TauE/SafE family protein [Mucilaginibacter straminoryzae]MCJ8208961.1 sulfite exporter TauE/SafE family protein [Mucilaginibacter straminoryzae]